MMSTAIDHPGRLAEPAGLPQLISVEIDRARLALAQAGRRPVGGVHEARQAIKTARALARLIADVDPGAATRLNAAGRRAAHALAAVRDADSLQAVARKAALRCPTVEAKAALLREASRARATLDTLDRPLAVSHAATSLDEMAAELSRLRVFDDPAAIIPNALRHAWMQAVSARLRAMEQQDTGSLHRLRKRVQDWRSYTLTLADLWPGDLPLAHSDTRLLAGTLGKHHDLSRLITALSGQRGAGADKAVGWLNKRRDKLARRALKRARAVFRSGLA